jgi:hypothetical protein
MPSAHTSSLVEGLSRDIMSWLIVGGHFEGESRSLGIPSRFRRLGHYVGLGCKFPDYVELKTFLSIIFLPPGDYRINQSYYIGSVNRICFGNFIIFMYKSYYFILS